MTTAALERDALMPRPPRGMGPGLLLALIVHVLLVAAIALSVRWHASEPEGVQAELWAAVPQIAAPRATAPEPRPTPSPVKPPEPVKRPPAPRVEPRPQAVRDAQIAIEKARRDEAKRREEQKEQAEKEKQRLEQEQKLKDAQDKRKKEQEAQKIEAQRQANLKHMMGAAGATGEPDSTGTAMKTAGPSATYGGRIKARIKPNIIVTDSIEGNPQATVRIRLAPDGTIVGKQLIKSSGVAAWDDAVMRAVDRTGVLPRDTDGTVPPTIDLVLNPRE